MHCNAKKNIQEIRRDVKSLSMWIMGSLYWVQFPVPVFCSVPYRSHIPILILLSATAYCYCLVLLLLAHTPIAASVYRMALPAKILLLSESERCQAEHSKCQAENMQKMVETVDSMPRESLKKHVKTCENMWKHLRKSQKKSVMMKSKSCPHLHVASLCSKSPLSRACKSSNAAGCNAGTNLDPSAVVCRSTPTL